MQKLPKWKGSAGMPEAKRPVTFMTVDAAGNLWVACWGGGCVQQFSATGKPLRTFALPAVQISSVAFGGAALCDLLVTSAATGLSGIQDGGIFLLSPGASGRAEFRARL